MSPIYNPPIILYHMMMDLSSIIPRKHYLITQPRKLPEKVHIREVQPVVVRLAAVLACVEVLHFELIEMLGAECFTVNAFFFQMIQHDA